MANLINLFMQQILHSLLCSVLKLSIFWWLPMQSLASHLCAFIIRMYFQGMWNNSTLWIYENSC